MTILLISAALADGLAAQAVAPSPFFGHPVLEVRGGVSGDATGAQAYLCGGLSPLAWLSVEGCGSGAGFLYPSNGPDLAHLRARARVASLRRDNVDFEGFVGAGVAEAERAKDAPGLVFGHQGGSPVETAGPEATVSASARAWLHPRAFVVLDVTGGAAWMVEAPAVLGAASEVVPFITLSAGAGF
ncbi:MAG: hypothetical protein Q8P18_31970 [Pseudomonadota bacterium]|nr:hypothetical protein [Pseudomonadota bacterium]